MSRLIYLYPILGGNQKINACTIGHDIQPFPTHPNWSGCPSISTVVGSKGSDRHHVNRFLLEVPLEM